MPHHNVYEYYECYIELIELTYINTACFYQWFRLSDTLIRKRSGDLFVDECFSIIIPRAATTTTKK